MLAHCSDFDVPELWEIKVCSSGYQGIWYFVTAVQADENKQERQFSKVFNPIWSTATLLKQVSAPKMTTLNHTPHPYVAPFPSATDQ